jgi:VWFA-related protein
VAVSAVSHQPSTPQLLATTVLLVLFTGVGSRGQQLPRFDERVRVQRIVVDARVLDDRGNPIAGLVADDFGVRIDGKRQRVESVMWVGEDGLSGGAEAGAAETAGAKAPPPQESSEAPPRLGTQGRLVVFLFQKDLEAGRIEGLMQMLFKSRNFLDTLTDVDRVAILSFDSHLKIWSDFTNDRDRLDRLLSHGLLFERPPPVQASGAPSLVERLDPDKGRRTYGIERALELIGHALEPLPGAKSLILIGHGFGHLEPGGVRMENDYLPARRALVAARTSVFALDVTIADYHSLEAGLQFVSEETGGFYARTHIFPDQAMRRLSGALAGYYVLFVETEESRRRMHDIDVTLTHRKGRVLATSSYAERID